MPDFEHLNGCQQSRDAYDSRTYKVGDQHQIQAWQSVNQDATKQQEEQCRHTVQTCNSGHGRLELRELITSTELNDFFCGTWAGLAQVIRLRRRVCKPLVYTQEVVYGFTSLTPAQANPQRLLELIREHWAIENLLHWRRDVTLKEDACQVRKGIAPRTLTLLNSFLLALFDWLGISNVASSMRLLAAHRPLPDGQAQSSLAGANMRTL
jgi:hypothetical protein